MPACARVPSVRPPFPDLLARPSQSYKHLAASRQAFVQSLDRQAASLPEVFRPFNGQCQRPFGLALPSSPDPRSALALLQGLAPRFQHRGFAAFSRKRLVQPAPSRRCVLHVFCNALHLPLPFAGPFPFRRHSWGSPLQSFSRHEPDTFRFAVPFFPLVVPPVLPQRHRFWHCTEQVLILTLMLNQVLHSHGQLRVLSQVPPA